MTAGLAAAMEEDEAERNETTLSQDDLFTTLSNHRRRCVLHHLKQNEGESSLRDLATTVAAWENDVDPAELTRQQRKRVYTALHQTHLPKMDSIGVVTYDNRGTVTLTSAAAEFDVYLEVVEKGEITWSQYYLLLAGLFGALTLAAWQDLLPAVLPNLGYAAICVIILATSAALHERWSRRGHIGSGRPPE